MFYTVPDVICEAASYGRCEEECKGYSDVGSDLEEVGANWWEWKRWGETMLEIVWCREEVDGNLGMLLELVSIVFFSEEENKLSHTRKKL